MRRLQLTVFLILLITIQSSAQANLVDRTKIGINEGQIYNSYVVYVRVNESGVKGILGLPYPGISIGDFSHSVSITQLENETGDFTYRHSATQSSGSWEGESNLDRMCGQAIYTDWEFWKTRITEWMDFNSDDFMNILIESDQFMGVVFLSVGELQFQNGSRYPTTHRQDCIYDKTSGSLKFFGLYQRTFYSSWMEEVSTVEQFILSTNTDQSVNSTLYDELVKDVPDLAAPTLDPKTTTSVIEMPSVVSTTSVGLTISETEHATPPTESQNSLSLELALSYWAILPILILPILSKRLHP